MRHPATLLPAGEGRRGDLLPAPSPEISAAHIPVKRSTGASGSGPRISHPAAFGSFPALRATGAASDAKAPTFSLTRAFPCARATSPAYGPGLSPRSPAGASGRCDCPNRCDGTGCAFPSAALPGRARPQSKPVSRFDRPALFPPQLFEAADNDGCPAPARGGTCKGRHFVTRHGLASNRRQYARAGLRLSPLSGAGIASRSVRGDINKSHALRCQPPSAAAWRIADTRGLEVRAALSGSSTAHSRISDRPALTSSALTADPRRADPGNLLAGAVAARLRPYHWPVALRGGGHIAGVV